VILRFNGSHLHVHMPGIFFCLVACQGDAINAIGEQTLSPLRFKTGEVRQLYFISLLFLTFKEKLEEWFVLQTG